MIILIELALLYFVTKKITSKAINNTVNYISANLNNIYIIQWMLVGTATFIVMMADIDDLNAPVSIALGLVFVVMSVLISKLYDLTKSKKEYKAHSFTIMKNIMHTETGL